MARLALTPTPMVPDNTAQNLTTLVSSIGANTGVSFSNSGREILVFTIGATATTATVNIGSSVLGQAVTNFSVVLPTNATSILGPFHSAVNQSGGSTVFVDTSQQTSVSVGLTQFTGVS